MEEERGGRGRGRGKKGGGEEGRGVQGVAESQEWSVATVSRKGKTKSPRAYKLVVHTLNFWLIGIG